MGRALVGSMIALALALLAVAATARADDSTPPAPSTPAAGVQAAEALFHQAEAEDAAGDYAHAVEHYRSAVRALPSFRFAPRAATRAALLEAHSEGGFVPYTRLEAVRRDPKAGDDPVAIDALARDAATFPAGPTRGEAWMVCAGAYLARLNREADGEAALRHVIDDPSSDTLLKRQAASQLVGALLSAGDLPGARDASQAAARWLDAKVINAVATAERRRWLHRASTADLAIFAALASVAIARAAARRRAGQVARALRSEWWLGVAFATYVACGGAVLATNFETGNATPFLLFGGALLPIAALSRAWGVTGSRARLARGARAALCASAVVAAAFLVLEAVNVQYLDGFDL